MFRPTLLLVLLSFLALADSAPPFANGKDKTNRNVVCPISKGSIPAKQQCAQNTDAASGDHCGACATNSDCSEGYHCSGNKAEQLICVLNDKCVGEGCMCERKRDCCGQPFPDTLNGEPDLRCRVPPVTHELYQGLGDKTRFCLPVSVWDIGA
mmetsp:Transcript_53830/g.161085  ORF Transcript_53830/g.161085 Transcript_53830/m.161085 type:complete len:153 (-) Transcript_53830:326-784(-)